MPSEFSAGSNPSDGPTPEGPEPVGCVPEPSTPPSPFSLGSPVNMT